MSVLLEQAKVPALWIGPTAFPEFHEAWEWCKTCHAMTQFDGIQQAIDASAEGVQRILFARTDRMLMSQSVAYRLYRKFPLARFSQLLGSLCEGEDRTGDLWPDCERIEWHRWEFDLKQWFNDVETIRCRKQMVPSRVAIVARDMHSAEHVVDSLQACDVPAILVDPMELAGRSGCEHLVWDDSVIHSSETFLNYESIARAAVSNHWMATAPRIESWNFLKSRGFSLLFSKPLNLTAMIKGLAQSRPMSQA